MQQISNKFLSTVQELFFIICNSNLIENILFSYFKIKFIFSYDKNTHLTQALGLSFRAQGPSFSSPSHPD